MGTVLNHTPGPWTVRDDGVSLTVEMKHERPYGWAQLDVARVYRTEHWQEDARLLAAAPDLLTELRKLVASNYGEPHGVTVPALDSARALLERLDA